jgi:hypothetical protein
MSEIIVGLLVTVGGSLINFVSTQIYNRVTGASRNFLWRESVPPINELKVSYTADTVKKLARIIVVDDEDHFPVDLFRNEGYSIEKWNRVQDYGKLASGVYDIIVLDIKGIAEHISAEDGLGVLEDLKNSNPAQIVIAYSQHSFDLSKSRFYMLADERIAKPSDFLRMKRIIDSLIASKFQPKRYYDQLQVLLKNNGVNSRDLRITLRELSKAAKGKRPMDWSRLNQYTNFKPEVQRQCDSLTGAILRFY